MSKTESIIPSAPLQPGIPPSAVQPVILRALAQSILPSPVQTIDLSDPVANKSRNNPKLFNVACVNCKLVCGPDTSTFRRRMGHESEYMCSACYWYDTRHGGQPRPASLIERQKQKATSGVTKVRRAAIPKPKYNCVKMTFYPKMDVIEEREQKGEVAEHPKHMAYDRDDLVAALILMKLSKVAA